MPRITRSTCAARCVPGLLVDSGPLFALANKRDHRHADAVAFFQRFNGSLVTTLAVLAEMCSMLPPHRVPVALRAMERSNFTLIHLPERELGSVAALIEKYADRPMDLADASLLWAADALGLSEIATLDSAFHVYRTRRGKALRNRFP